MPSTGLVFELLLHLGTLLAVLAFYRSDIVGLFAAIPRAVGAPLQRFRDDAEVRLGILILIASAPTAAIGLAFKDRFEALAERPAAVGLALLLTAALLAATHFIRTDERRLSAAMALLIGIAQGLAITPGISRSGATIAVALLLGVAARDAARFSFLIAIPAILGAVVLKLGSGAVELQLLPSIIGFTISAGVGFLALRWLVALVAARRFAAFAPYCALIGLIALGFGK